MSKYKKRADGRYQTSVVVDGKKKWISASSSDELDKKVTEIKYLGNKGISLNNEDITLSTFADKWFEINSVGKEDGTIKEYKYIINSYIKPKLGHLKIKKIKVYDIQEVVNTLISEDHIRLAKKFLLYTKKILNDAVQNDIILKNPASLIKSPTYKPNERKPLTDEEDRLLIKCSKSHKYGLFFLLIRFTGIRKEEASAIEIDDIDLENNIISINKAVSFATNQGKIKTTKNKKDRNVYILDIFRGLLEDRVQYCKENNIQYLFTKQTNPKERLSDSAITTMCSSFLLYINNTYKKELEEKQKDKKEEEKETPIKIKFTLHQLRHSFCTMLYYSEIGIKEAQELMGHSSADMVYDIYTHLDMEKGKPFDKLNKSIQKFM
jgi:integrase